MFVSGRSCALAVVEGDRLRGFHSFWRKPKSLGCRKTRRFLVESLEDRSLLAAVFGSAVAQKLSSSGQAAALVDDVYEENDTAAMARPLGALSAPLTINNLAMADSSDWYRFGVSTPPGASDTVSINLQNWQGDLDLALYNIYGQRVRYSGTTNNTEQVSLNGLAAGTYYIRVYGYLGATNPNYSLSIKVGAATQAGDDVYENNDTFGTARDLGTLTSLRTISNLVMADGHDWYRFTMNGAGTSSDFVAASFQNVQGNLDLELYNASGTRLAVSNGLSNSEAISLAGRAAGTYYVHVYGVNGATNPSYSLQIDPGTTTTTTPPPSTGAFNIQFRFNGLTSSQQSIFQQAAAKWQSIITGDLPGVTYGGVAVDDLLIDARGKYIDGTGNVLGQAGPDALRAGSSLPYHGVMEFDTADLASMQSNGTLLGVIEHEMGHVLGFGTIWSNKGLLVGASTSNPRFVGAQATAAYNSIFGTAATGVPVENTGGSGTRNSHWRESIFGTELMTGWIGPGSNMPISRITVGSLADLGYTVNYVAADPFGPSAAVSASLVGATISTGGTSSMAGAASHETPALLPLHERVHAALLASWHVATQRGQGESMLTPANGLSREAATDALFERWQSLSSLG
jgi:Leishmanolysin/Bacterial pre-peptidase C-terminal domain